MIWDDASDGTELLDLSGVVNSETLLLPETDQAEPKAKAWSVVWEIVETILLAAVIWLGVNFATARYIVEGVSMEPNLHTGQFLIVNKLAYRFGDPARGDVIVFDYPNNTNDDYVKRIIGLPGETVTVDRSGSVYINGTRLNEPYIVDAASVYQGEWLVPEDSYFVMGDNRRSSSDSRTWESLASHYIIGKVWISYWPPSLWGLAPHYAFPG